MATFTEKVRLLRGLLNREIASVGPFFATVDVTRRCNLKCLGCRCHSPYVDFPAVRDPSTHDVDVDMFRKLCDELKALNTRTLVLSGDGEPLLHPRLTDLVLLAKNAGFQVKLYTNGTLMNETIARSLIDCRLDVLRVSLWATSPDEYALNHPSTNPDLFSRVVSGLSLLSSAKRRSNSSLPHLVLHLVINCHNYRSVDSFVDLAVSSRCDAVSFSPLHTLQGRLNPFALSQNEERTVCASLDRAKERLRAAGLDHNIDETISRYDIGDAVLKKVPCYIAWLHARVKVDGTVQPCNPCDWPAGDLRENTFREIWNGPGFRSFRRKALASNGPSFADELCDCSYCCHITDNVRVQRIYKWISPLLPAPAD